MTNIAHFKTELESILSKLSPNKIELLFTEYSFVHVTFNKPNIIDPESHDLFSDDLPFQNATEQIGNCHYTILDKTVFYEMPPPQKEGETSDTQNTDDIKKQIFIHALQTGKLGIVRDIVKIEKELEKFETAQTQSEINSIRINLNELNKIYHQNLLKLEKIDSDNIPLYTNLRILNTFYPLPKGFDTRAVQVASHVPNQQGTYRRSQDNHDYHQTNPDGVKIIPVNDLKSFKEKYPARDELFILINDDKILIKYFKNKTVSKKLNSTPELSRLKSKKRFTHIDSLIILHEINNQFHEGFKLKYELNEFGKKIEHTISTEGAPYNVGANATQIDKVIQFDSNTQSSKKNNNKNVLLIKDKILGHKNNVVNKLVRYLSSKELHHLQVDIDQLKAQYPCLIVTFKSINIEQNKELDFIPEGYDEFITHLMIAQINLILKQNNLPPLIDRRQSFGFLTPTLTSVHTGVRLSIGLTPNDGWIECVKKGIEQTDEILRFFSFKKEQDELLDNKFRGGELSGDGHKYILSFFKQNEDNKIAKAKLNEFLENIKLQLGEERKIIFRRKNKDQNLEKKQHDKILSLMCRGYITKYYLFDEQRSKIICYENNNNLPIEFPIKDIEKMYHFLFNNFSSTDEIKLIEQQEQWLLEAIQANVMPFNLSVDEEYRVLYRHVMAVYKKILDEPYDETVEQAIELEKWTRDLLTTQNKVIQFLLSQKPLATEETSEDDTGDLFACKNYYSPAGMSSLYAPLVAARKIAEICELPFPYECDYSAYFEVILSWKKTLNSDFFVRSNLLEEQIKNRIFKQLLSEYGEFDSSIDNFFTKLIDFASTMKRQGKVLSEEDFLLYAENSISNSQIKFPDYKNACRLIFKGFPHYYNPTDIIKLSKPIVHYLDNNPCFNKNKMKPMLPVDMLTKLCEQAPFPKILILDVTSSTQSQINQFLEVFNKQDKIPILVTASSMVKHSELGLDLWQGGENKTYLSKACNTEDATMFNAFLVELKNTTKGTESGLGRFARRLIRKAINTVYIEQIAQITTIIEQAENIQDGIIKDSNSAFSTSPLTSNPQYRITIFSHIDQEIPDRSPDSVCINKDG